MYTSISGRGGSLQPRQRHDEGQANCLGWARQSSCFPVHGSVDSQSLEPRHQGLLPAAAESRQAEESCSHSLRAEATDNPQHYGKDGCSLGSDHSQALTFDTVAIRSLLI